MRRLIILFALVTLFGVMTVGVAQADPDGSNPNSASISRDFGCNVFDGDGNLVFTTGSLSIVTSSGHTTLKCSADVENTTGKAQVMKGFGCNTFLGFTTNSHSTVSASGKSTLTCRVNP